MLAFYVREQILFIHGVATTKLTYIHIYIQPIGQPINRTVLEEDCTLELVDRYLLSQYRVMAPSM